MKEIIKMKCLVYCRQSVGNEDISESVENQVMKCEDLAKKEGLEIAGIFRDLNISGKTYPTGSEAIATMDIAFQKWYKEQTTRKMYREGLGKLIEKLSTEHIDYILVYDVTRLYRPVTGSFLESHINQILMMHNIKVMTLNQGIIDFGNFNDSLITALQNRINHEQIAIQRRKSKEALKNLKDSGAYLPSIHKKWGFDLGPGKKEIVVNEKEAEMVKLAFDMIYNGYTMRKTVKDINTRYKDMLGKTGINPTFLKRMLASPIYCGYLYNSKGELIKSLQTDGFIEFSVWKEVQDIFASHKYYKRKDKKGHYPLTGLISCGCCGKRMNICLDGHNKKKLYVCHEHKRINGHVYCGTNIRVTHDSKWGEGLQEAIYPILSLAALKELETSHEESKVREELTKMKVEVQNLLEREKKLTGMFINGLIDETSLENALHDITVKKKSIQMTILNLENMLKSEDNSVEKQIELLKSIVEHTITPEEYEKLIRKTVKHMYVYTDKLIIETFFGEFELPRQNISKYRLLPHYFMNMDNEYNINLIYYYGLEQLIPDVGWKTNLIADFGKLKIWYKKAGAN